MSILSPFTGLVRSALGVAEREETEAVAHSPIHAAVAAEEELEHLVRALYSAAESAERQAEVLGGVARALPVLTEQVTALTARVAAMDEHAIALNRQLGELVDLLAPIAEAERDVSRVERLFRRRRRAGGSRVGPDQPG